MQGEREGEVNPKKTPKNSMANVTKQHQPINGADVQRSLFAIKSNKKVACFLFIIVASAFFCAFSLSSSSYSPPSAGAAAFRINNGQGSESNAYGSLTSSVLSYFFPISSFMQQVSSFPSDPPMKINSSSTSIIQSPRVDIEDTSNGSRVSSEKAMVEGHASETESGDAACSPLPDNGDSGEETGGGIDQKSTNSSATIEKNTSHENEDLASKLKNCNFYDGKWVKDDSYPLYASGSCSINEQFSCTINGRPDKDYEKLKWKPHGCSLPRLDGKDFLRLLKGKRLVIVGDSLSRNMWESLVCVLRNSVKDKTMMFESHGRRRFRGAAAFSSVSKDYNSTVDSYVSPFLVQVAVEGKDRNGVKKESLRLDRMAKVSKEYKNADIFVFNTGHWWTHEKTSKGQDYYQEGDRVYKELDVLVAYEKALTTWAAWVDANTNPAKSLVFFRGYSATHFRGGQWNSGGQCHAETEPIQNETYLGPPMKKMKILEGVLSSMKTPVIYMNVTKMTDFRKDAHPSIYRKPNQKTPLKFQDCSHWCLPGVPDAWNEILYAELLRKDNQKTG